MLPSAIIQSISHGYNGWYRAREPENQKEIIDWMKAKGYEWSDLYEEFRPIREHL